MLVKRAVPVLLALIMLSGFAAQALAQPGSAMRGGFLSGGGQALIRAGQPLPGMARPLALGTGQPLIQPGRAPIIEARAVMGQGAVPVGGGSLFAGRAGGGLFAPYAPRRRHETGVSRLPLARYGPAGPRGVALVRALIGQAEAGARGYDAVQYGARIKPAKPPTRMTIQEIYDWIAATPGQPHAIGYYQFIPSTLRRLVAMLDLPPDQVFTPRLQDRLADILLAEAGLHALGRGEIDRHTFMNNMAKIWAGLPNATGKSHYDGYAGNRAALSWDYFDRQMARVFPG